MFRYVAFILGTLMLLPLSVLSALQNSNRLAIFYGCLLLLLFVICFFNVFFNQAESDNNVSVPNPTSDGNKPNSLQDHSEQPNNPNLTDQQLHITTQDEVINFFEEEKTAPLQIQVHQTARERQDPSFTAPAPNSPQEEFQFSNSQSGIPANPQITSANQDDPTEVDLSGFSSQSNTDRGRMQPKADQSQTSASPSSVAKTIRTQSLSQSDNIHAMGNIDAILMGSLDRKVEIKREEINGYLIQTTIITEKKRLAVSQTSQTLSRLGLNTSISDDDIDPVNLNNFSINDPDDAASSACQTMQQQPPREKVHFHPLAYTFRILKYMLALTALCVLIIILIWLVNSHFAKERTLSNFVSIINSLEPVKQQVSACIKAEGPRYLNICNDKHRSEEKGWDLSDRFLSNSKDPHIAAIRVDGGTITAYTNYDHELQGTTYVIVPSLANDGTVTWHMSPNSTCLQLKICQDTTGKSTH